MNWDIVSDIHSCITELYALLEKLNYKWDNGLYIPPSDYKLISVGDFISRGYYTVATFNFVRDMVAAGHMLATRGNHEEKLMKWALGRPVKLNHGDEKAAEDFEKHNVDKQSIVDFLSTLPLTIELDEGKLIVVHAAYSTHKNSKSFRAWSLFGPVRSVIDGTPDRIDWAAERVVDENSPIVVCGHQPLKEVRIINKVYQIDTACVFGEKLTCVEMPGGKIVQVEAERKYCENINW